MAGYIQFIKQKGVEYGELRVSYWDAQLSKYKKTTKYLGRVIDKDLLIFKNRADGMFQFNLETKSKQAVPDGFVAPSIRYKPRGISKQYEDARSSSSAVSSSSLQADTFPDVVTFGNEYVYDKLINDYLGDAILKFEEVEQDSVKALVMFYALCKEAHLEAQDWYKQSYARLLYPQADLSAQMLSKLLAKLGDDSYRTTLLSEFCKTLKTKFRLPVCRVAIDSIGAAEEVDFSCTDISNRNGVFHNEIRLLLVADRDTGMPLYYRAYPSNVIDKKNLDAAFEQLEELSVLPEYVVVDAGYSYKESIDVYSQHAIDFLIRVPASSRLFKDLLATHLDKILKDPNNIVQYEGRGLCIKCIPAVIGGNECSVHGYAYICVDWSRRAAETAAATHSLSTGAIENDAFTHSCRLAGVFMLAGTNDDLTPAELLLAYDSKADIERTFDICMNNASMLPLSIEQESTFAGHVLISYMSTILHKIFQSKSKTSSKCSAADLRRKLNAHKAQIRTEDILLSDVDSELMQLYELVGLTPPKVKLDLPSQR